MLFSPPANPRYKIDSFYFLESLSFQSNNSGYFLLPIATAILNFYIIVKEESDILKIIFIL